MTAIMSNPATAPAFSSDPMAWFRARQRQLLIAGGVVLGIGVIGGYLWWAQVNKEEFAANALEQARTAADGANGLAASAGMLQRIIEQYNGTDAAQEAVLTLAQVRMINGQDQLAAAALQEFVKQGPRAKYAAPAHGLLGGALENTGHPVEAAQNYLAASQAADVDALRSMYLVDAARAFVLGGDTANGLDALRKVVKDYAKTPSATEAGVRLSEMTKGAEPVATH